MGFKILSQTNSCFVSKSTKDKKNEMIKEMKYTTTNGFNSDFVFFRISFFIHRVSILMRYPESVKNIGTYILEIKPFINSGEANSVGLFPHICIQTIIIMPIPLDISKNWIRLFTSVIFSSCKFS